MTGTRRVEFVGLLLLTAALVGCSSGKHASQPTTTTTIAGTSTTPSTLTRRAVCAGLFDRTRAIRAAEAPIDTELSEAVAVAPGSEVVARLKNQRQQLERELADVRRLITRIEAANGRSTCPAK